MRIRPREGHLWRWWWPLGAGVVVGLAVTGVVVRWSATWGVAAAVVVAVYLGVPVMAANLGELGAASDQPEPTSDARRILRVDQKSAVATSDDHDQAGQALWPGTITKHRRRWGDEILALTWQFQGREDELRKIQEFARSDRKATSDGPPSDVGYLWYKGPALAGKTSLLAEAARLLANQPSAAVPDVAVVTYFLSANSSNRYFHDFVGSVIGQLSDLLEQATPGDLNKYAFWDLLDEAAKFLAGQGRRLLLIVDALDEDDALSGRRKGESIAAQLPLAVPANAHVLVSSREEFEVPGDVRPGHPLRETRPCCLAPYQGVIPSKVTWQKEYRRISPASLIEKDVLAALAAAGGPLSVEDISQLLAKRHPSQDRLDEEIERIVRRFGTSLRQVDDRNGAVHARRYTFAHNSFGEEARNDPELPVRALWRLLVDWARGWAGRPEGDGILPGHTGQWPADTPLYLVQEYPVRLKEEDPRALVRLTQDLDWIVRAIQRAGARSVVPVLMAARDIKPDDPVVAARLSTLQGQLEALDSEDVPSTAFVLRQLCMQAGELGERVLEDKLRSRLPNAGPADPCLIPAWTTRNAYRGLVSRLDTAGKIFSSLAAYQPPWARASAPHDRGFVVGGTGDGHVWVWDLEARTRSSLLGHHVGPVRAVAVRPEDGCVVTGGDDGRLLTWLLSQGIPDEATPRDRSWARSRLFADHNGPVSALAWDVDGKKLWSAGPGGIHRWDCDGDAVAKRLEIRYRHFPAALVALPGERVAVGGLNDSILEIFPEAGAAYEGPERHGAGIAALVLAQNGPYKGSLLAGEKDGTLRAWNVRDRPAAPVEVDKIPAGITSAAWLSDDRLATGCEDGRILAWRFSHRVPRIEIGRHDGPVRAMAALPNGQVVTSGQDGSVCVWDPTGAEGPGQPRLQANERSQAVRSLGWLAPAAVAVGGQDNLDREPAAVAVGGQDGLLRIRPLDAPQPPSPERGGPPAPDIDSISAGRAITSIAVWNFAPPKLVATLSRGALWHELAMALGCTMRTPGRVDGVAGACDRPLDRTAVANPRALAAKVLICERDRC